MRSYAYDKNRPYIPIVLWHGYRKVRIFPLLDTGADVSILHKTDALALGLDWNSGNDCTAENSDGSLFRVREFRIEIEVAEARFPAKVLFADTKSDIRLLGRADVFRNFRITIDEKEMMVDFEVKEGNPFQIYEEGEVDS